MTHRTCLGKIAAVHGVKGLVKILPYGQDATLIETLGPAARTPTPSQDEPTPLTIRLKNPAGKYILAEVEGCTSRNDAEALKGAELYYDRALLPETKEGEFYYDDLQGLPVYENDTLLGHIKAVQNFGASDLFEIKPQSGSTYFIPYADAYIINIDLKAGRIDATNTADFRDMS